MRELGLRTGDVQLIEQSGARVLSDCCAVTLPVSLRYRNMATDSAKACLYMSDFGLNVRFGSTVQCLEAGIRGSWEEKSV